MTDKVICGSQMSIWRDLSSFARGRFDAEHQGNYVNIHCCRTVRSDSRRVSRGGGWNDDAGCCRAGNRLGFGPGHNVSILGLRCWRKE